MVQVILTDAPISPSSSEIEVLGEQLKSMRNTTEFYRNQSRFERLIAEISCQYINLLSSEIDEAINKALERIGKFLGVDRCMLWCISEDKIDVVYHWESEGVKPLPNHLSNASDSLPWFVNTLKYGNVAKFSRLDDLPIEDRNIFKKYDTNSGISIPITAGGSIVNCISIGTIQTNPLWPEELVQQLRLVGSIFAHLLSRRQRDLEIEDALAQRTITSEFARLLSEISATYINLPIKELEEVLKNDFERLSRTLGVDGCILHMRDEESRAFHVVKPMVWFIDEGQEANRRLAEWLKHKPVVRDSNFPYSFTKYNRGESVEWRRTADIPDDAYHERAYFQEVGVQANLTVPILFAGVVTAIVNVFKINTEQPWQDDLSSLLRLLGEVFVNAFMRKQSEEKLQQAFAEIRQLKNQLHDDYIYLKEEIQSKYDIHNMIGKSKGLGEVFSAVQRIGPTNTSVLILGETGTGKELVARAIHATSQRSDRPMVVVNCAALSASLIESELFGHEKGAFTGAQSRNIGRFELADGKTLFLDEIGELPLESQAKLLRVLQEGEFQRLGSNRTIKVDVRVVAATNRDLDQEVKKGRFRQDLWYRLNVFPINIPPLRDRKGDIPLLVESFVDKLSRKLGKTILRVPSGVIKDLQEYHWPGNIRELENLIERAVINTEGTTLRLKDRLEHRGTADMEVELGTTMREVERMHILQTLRKTNWRIDGPKGAALLLEINTSTLRSRMRKLGICRDSR